MPKTNPNPSPAPTDLTGLPPTLDVPTTAHLLGISRASAYRLAAADELPVPVLRVGHSLRIPTAPLLNLLGITTQEPASGDGNGAERDGVANERAS